MTALTDTTTRIILAAAGPLTDPGASPRRLPGTTSSEIYSVVAAIKWLALVIVGIMIVWNFGQLAMSKKTGNIQGASSAKTGIAWGLAGAAGIAMAIPLVNWVFGIGLTLL